MLPDAGEIKRAVQTMVDKAADLGIDHAERELQVQPRTFARERKSVFANVDEMITNYGNTRAFEITGLVKQEVLDSAKTFVTEWVKRNKAPYPTDEMERELLALLSDWLPAKDAAGRIVNVAARAKVIARTNVSDIFNNTRYQIFSSPQLDNWIEAFVYTAVLDGRTTELCRSLDGRIFRKDEVQGYVPPNHYNCRSVILPITRLDQGWEEAYERQAPVAQIPQEGFFS